MFPFRAKQRILGGSIRQVGHFVPNRVWFHIPLVTGLILTSAAVAQTPSVSENKVTARSELVTLSVVVIDKSGSHIEDLNKEDFTLLEDGKEQNIAIFEKTKQKTGSAPHIPTPLKTFSNVPTGDASLTQRTIIALDMINTPVQDQIHAKDELLKFVADSTNLGRPISLLTISRTGVRLIHHFTDDPKLLVAALNHVNRSQPPVTEDPSWAFLPDGEDKLSKMLRPMGEFQIDAEQAALSLERRTIITMTLQALQQIATAFAGLPGRKNLIWATAGFPFTINETTMALKEGGAGLDSPAEMVSLYQRTWNTLTQAQISVYPLDVRGTVNLPGPSPVPTKKSLPDPFIHGQWQQAGTIGTFESFARATAGRAFYNSNDLKSALQQAADDSASYYSLGYYFNRMDKKTGWHELGVKVKRDGVRVLARTGFFVADPAVPSQHDANHEVQIARESSLDYTAIAITAKWDQVQAVSGGKKKVIFVLTMPPNFADVDESDRNHFLLEFWTTARTPTGSSAADVEQTMEGHFKPDTLDRFRHKGTDYRGALTVRPGDYTVRFVVRDRLSGRIGSLTAPLTVAP
jgi:VWFA-related protein